MTDRNQTRDKETRAGVNQAPRSDRPDRTGRELFIFSVKASLICVPAVTSFMAFMSAARTLVTQHQLNDTGLLPGLVAILSAILFIFSAYFAYGKIFRSGLNVSRWI